MFETELSFFGRALPKDMWIDQLTVQISCEYSFPFYRVLNAEIREFPQAQGYEQYCRVCDEILNDDEGLYCVLAVARRRWSIPLGLSSQ